ncbi:MAG: bifunctional alpha,alpha-trehalose-phosphate synthase (UDP-forming)/trehalose-phosphatase [Flavobacteriaceae bacterium]
MPKNIIVSNRLPVQIEKTDDNFEIHPSSGGLATGLKSVHGEGNSIWIGWPGIKEEALDETEKKIIGKRLHEKGFEAVHLNTQEMDDFYYGLSNTCLWPLFHYFTEFTHFDENQWNSYREVNQKFADAIIENSEEDDIIWIHDYQLLLCPAMVREKRPNVCIGFFLHIPFPSFEIFRIFPKREELLKGMLGADLLGFHTYDYQRHFISSVTRILRLTANFNELNYSGRNVVVNTFPMGIDYAKFESFALKHQAQKEEEKSELRKQLEIHKNEQDALLILSIDRLDYTKGVVNRLEAFEQFLEQHPEYIGKARLIMLAVPSRSNVPQYQQLKNDTDQMVGRINGKFAQVNWTPVWYFYRSMPFEDLIDLYISSDIAMITPVRDGMNLVAKEYLATRVEGDGILILSEMAGAAKELHQAIMVNPFDPQDMVNALKTAADMTKEEQIQRNKISRNRIKRYHVEHWAQDFMRALNEVKIQQEKNQTPRLNSQMQTEIKTELQTAKNAVLFLDFDGTLVNFHDDPLQALPSKDTLDTLKKLQAMPNVDPIIISGRSMGFLEEIFGPLGLNLIGEHGYQIKHKSTRFDKSDMSSSKWKEHLIPVLEGFCDRTPGTFIEEKKYALVWHYRKADPELSRVRASELQTLLKSLITSDLAILDGDCVIEIAHGQINKGSTALALCNENQYDFIMAIGDDVTDENMFIQLPENTHSIKVGKKETQAKNYLPNVEAVQNFLKSLVE